MLRHLFYFTFSLLIALPVKAETGRILLVNGGISVESNYPEFEQDLRAFRDHYPNLPYILLNAGGPLDNMVAIRGADGIRKKDEFGFLRLTRGTFNENAKAATSDNLLNALSQTLATNDRDVLIFFGGHGSPSKYSLWTTSPDISYADIRKALTKDPYEDRRLVRVMHYECFGGAAVVDSSRPNLVFKDAKSYLETYYPRNHCQLAFADEEETATSEFDRTVAPYRLRRTIDQIFQKRVSDGFIKWMKSNSETAQATNNQNMSSALNALEKVVSRDKKETVRLIDSYRRSRSSWPRFLAETKPLTLANLKSKIGSEDRRDADIFATFSLTSDYLVDDIFRAVCKVKRPTLSVSAEDVIIYLKDQSPGTQHRVDPSVPRECAEVVKLDTIIREDKTKIHVAADRAGTLSAAKTFCEKAAFAKAEPAAFKEYEESRKTFYQPLSPPASKESVATWSTRIAANVAKTVSAFVVRDQVTKISPVARTKAFNECLQITTKGQVKSLEELNAARDLFSKDTNTRSWQATGADYRLQNYKRKIVEDWLKAQSPQSEDARTLQNRYQNLKSCENGSF
jgi:hypothetical protein